MVTTCKACDQLKEVEKLLVKSRVILDDLYHHNAEALPGLLLTSAQVNSAQESLKLSIEKALEKGI